MSDDWRTAWRETLWSLILRSEPDIVEGASGASRPTLTGVLTFSCAGLVRTIETYKDNVKLTFAKGASLEDPSGLVRSLQRQPGCRHATCRQPSRG